MVVGNNKQQVNEMIEKKCERKSALWHKIKNRTEAVAVSVWTVLWWPTVPTVAEMWWIVETAAITVPAAVKTAGAAWATISLAAALTSCQKDEDDDIVAPTVNVSRSNVEVEKWSKVEIQWNMLFIGGEPVVTWKDNETANCAVSLSYNGKNITSWYDIQENGKLEVIVRDEAWNTTRKSVNVKIQVIEEKNESPEITVLKPTLPKQICTSYMTAWETA